MCGCVCSGLQTWTEEEEHGKWWVVQAPVTQTVCSLSLSLSGGGPRPHPTHAQHWYYIQSKSDNKSLVNEILRSTREKIGNGGVRFVWLWLTHFSRLRLSVLLLPQWCQVQFRQNWYHYQDTVLTTNPALSFMKRYTKIGLHNNLETYLYNTLLKGGKLEHWSF